MWTSTIRNAILCEDQSRKIMSGMHGLSAEPNNTWSIQMQGQLTDILTPHPYPSPSVGGDVAPMNMLRTTLVPTFQCEYYSGIGKKPAMIQESGTFSNMIGMKGVNKKYFKEKYPLYSFFYEKNEQLKDYEYEVQLIR